MENKPKREAIGKKIRFEVFKRDSFKCQYCGKSAPEVVLNVDHIKPVSKGGTNEIVNLITSCWDCNIGKSDRELKDNAVVSKQKNQLDDLNEKRVQLEMMSEWRSELMSMEDIKIKMLNDTWRRFITEDLSACQIRLLRPIINRYEMPLLLDSLEASLSQYLVFDKKGNAKEESIQKALGYIESIAKNKKRAEKNPHLKRLYYARGILRNRFKGQYFDDKKIIIQLDKTYRKGASTEEIVELCKYCNNWSHFRDLTEQFISGKKTIETLIKEVGEVG